MNKEVLYCAMGGRASWGHKQLPGVGMSVLFLEACNSRKHQMLLSFPC